MVKEPRRWLLFKPKNMKHRYRASIAIYSVCIIFLAFESCFVKKQQTAFNPPNKDPIYSIAVDDASEAALLQQQLKLNVVKIENNRMYFSNGSNSLANKLKELGYEKVIREDLLQVYKKYCQIRQPATEDSMQKNLLSALSRQDVQVVNREKDHWVIYGSLKALNSLKKAGYVISNLPYELRPREIEVTVKTTEDVQKVAAANVDIFSAERDRATNGIIIHGSAFDYQIDKVRDMGFGVTIKKQRL
jgi:hypothetical protein